jgi:hypothetical protein
MLPGVSDSAGDGAERAIQSPPAADSIHTPLPSSSPQEADQGAESERDGERTKGASEVPGDVSQPADRDRIGSHLRSVEGNREDVVSENRQEAAEEQIIASRGDVADETRVAPGYPDDSESRLKAEAAAQVEVGSEPGEQGGTEVVMQDRAGAEEPAPSGEQAQASPTEDTYPGTAAAGPAASEAEETGRESCLEIIALRGVYINIVSGDETLLDDQLNNGDRRRLCSSLPFVVVSLTDRYAVSMTLDGEPVDLAVSPGREIYDFTVPGYHEIQ